MSLADPRSLLPSVDTLLSRPELFHALETTPRRRVVAAARTVLAKAREALQGRADSPPVPSLEVLCEKVLQTLEQMRPLALRPAINATGVILHTGLGRAVLGEAARHALAAVAAGYSVLEIERTSGRRSEREHAVAALVCELSGAEAATVVNNCAGACLLMLAALCRGREVIVARGQLVEIGGSFRVPEVMEQSGARLREVGATNRVHLQDYERAIGPETAAILKVHTSNFRVLGFHKEVPSRELAALAAEHDLLMLEDLGSGNLVDLTRFGLPAEPCLADAISNGVDVVTCSGDKLLGGPQAGVICGRTDLIRTLRAHPLFRALRPDKLCLAALEATLRIHLDGVAHEALPALRMLTIPPTALRPRGEALVRKVLERLAALGEKIDHKRFQLEVIEHAACAGSGALPAVEIPSVAVALRVAGRSAERLSHALRVGDAAVFARVRDEQVIFDLRTVLPEQDEELAAAIALALRGQLPDPSR